MNEQDQILYNRIIELSNRAYKNNIYVFSDFLSLSQQDLFFQAARDKSFAPIAYDLFGGYENCERKMVRFGSENDFGYEVDFLLNVSRLSHLPRNSPRPTLTETTWAAL